MGNVFNRTVIIGRLGKDPEFKHGTKADYTKFTIYNWTVKDGKEETVWHEIAAFDRQAVLCRDYLHKGELCCIEGRLDETNYEGKVKQTIIAERVVFLSSKKHQNENKQEAVCDEI